MKTTLKLLFILLFYVYNGNISAQGPSKVQQQYTIRGANNEYSISRYNDFYYMSNVNNIYTNVSPNYNVGMDEYIPFAIFAKGDRQKLEQLTDSILGNHIFNVPKNWEKDDFAYINMRSDMKGKIKDIVFGFPNALSIPIEKIETLEALIKKELTLQFKIDHRNKDAVYMSRLWYVQFEPMREKRKK